MYVPLGQARPSCPACNICLPPPAPPCPQPRHAKLRLALAGPEYLVGVLAAKSAGNAQFQAEDFAAAVRSYMAGMTLLQNVPDMAHFTGSQRSQAEVALVTLASNMAAAMLKEGRHDDALNATHIALEAVKQGASVKPGLVQKTMIRRAQALIALQEWDAAVATLKHGSVANMASARKLLVTASDGRAAAQAAGRKVWTKAFTSAADENAMDNVARSAAAGSMQPTSEHKDGLGDDAREEAVGAVHSKPSAPGAAEQQDDASPSLSVFAAAQKRAQQTAAAVQASTSPVEEEEGGDAGELAQALLEEQRPWYKKKRVWLGAAAAAAAAAAVAVSRKK